MTWSEAQSYCRQHYTDLATVSSEEDVAKWVFVEEGKTWSEAQSYCRQSYTDLASIRNLAENEEIRGLISNSSWIGLFRDGWKWSDGREAEFRMWASGQPDNSGSNEHCVVMSTSGVWSDFPCSRRLPFICYNGSSRWIFVEEGKTWSEAQSHCRQNYTDLASVRNLAANEEIRGLISNSSWIGLFRDTWKWSDGSTMSFSKWYYNQPEGGDEHCVVSLRGKWHDYLCSRRFYFVCYSAQSYCRQHYTDLATVSSEEDVVKLNDVVGSHPSWIGLYYDINSWRWSLQNKSYYGEGEAEFRMWASGQPDNYYSDEYCVVMTTEGQWGGHLCSHTHPFICYNGENKTTCEFIQNNNNNNINHNFCHTFFS
uniref:C-type lectin domain-containing protein n=1 Tax=Myripristis murdjan TaxID=586833 RepID=A0A667WH85_9TELE